MSVSVYRSSVISFFLVSDIVALFSDSGCGREVHVQAELVGDWEETHCLSLMAACQEESALAVPCPAPSPRCTLAGDAKGCTADCAGVYGCLGGRYR